MINNIDINSSLLYCQYGLSLKMVKDELILLFFLSEPLFFFPQRLAGGIFMENFPLGLLILSHGN